MAITGQTDSISCLGGKGYSSKKTRSWGGRNQTSNSASLAACCFQRILVSAPRCGFSDAVKSRDPGAVKALMHPLGIGSRHCPFAALGLRAAARVSFGHRFLCLGRSLAYWVWRIPADSPFREQRSVAPSIPSRWVQATACHGYRES
jgi:hypothetical protein